MAKVLNSSNPHLKSPISRRDGVYRTVATSSAIEGIQVVKKTKNVSDATRVRSSEKRPPKDK